MENTTPRARTAGGKAGLGPKYDFSRLSVLIAEDSGPARTLLAGALGDLGVGHVRSVSSAGAAIEYLKNTRPKDDRWAHNHPVDILITDFEMEPVDGLTLLKWVRCHADSPNRFMRISLMSGSVSWERVTQGRNAGANALFAKPFTLKGLRDHLNGLIRSERPFVHVKSYFGPDRRRDKADAVLSERRGPDMRSEVLGEGLRPYFGWFALPNYLERIATGTDRGDINYFDLADAHARLKPFSQDYGDWVLDDLVTVRRAFDLMREAPAERDMRLNDMRRTVDRIARQSPALGYPLMMQVARSLAGILNFSGMDYGRFEKTVRVHLKVMDTIAASKLQTDAGEAGRAVLAQLGQAASSLTHRTGVVR